MENLKNIPNNFISLIRENGIRIIKYGKVDVAIRGLSKRFFLKDALCEFIKKPLIANCRFLNQKNKSIYYIYIIAVITIISLRYLISKTNPVSLDKIIAASKKRSDQTDTKQLINQETSIPVLMRFIFYLAEQKNKERGELLRDTLMNRLEELFVAQDIDPEVFKQCSFDEIQIFKRYWLVFGCINTYFESFEVPTSFEEGNLHIFNEVLLRSKFHQKYRLDNNFILLDKHITPEFYYGLIALRNYYRIKKDSIKNEWGFNRWAYNEECFQKIITKIDAIVESKKFNIYCCVLIEDIDVYFSPSNKDGKEVWINNRGYSLDSKAEEDQSKRIQFKDEKKVLKNEKKEEIVA